MDAVACYEKGADRGGFGRCFRRQEYGMCRLLRENGGGEKGGLVWVGVWGINTRVLGCSGSIWG